jgi:hypothetical protein
MIKGGSVGCETASAALSNQNDAPYALGCSVKYVPGLLCQEFALGVDSPFVRLSWLIASNKALDNTRNIS